MDLDTKYPILFVHGMGFRDNKIFKYWGRIPKRLIQSGAKVFYGKQDSNGSVESNARQVAKSLDSVLEQTGAKKVNIIAHSKGGLEARYLISTMGYADRVASLTTLSTPHHGSETVDALMRFPKGLIRFGCKVVDVWFRICGDKKPSTYEAITSFQTEYAKEFNESNPDMDGVYYQSYGFVMKHVFSDLFFWLTYPVVYFFEGENDGLLAPRAVRWTNFQGVYRGNGRRGISHCDEVDLRRHRLTRKQGDGISDITTLYLDIVRGLKEKGL